MDCIIIIIIMDDYDVDDDNSKNDVVGIDHVPGAVFCVYDVFL